MICLNNLLKTSPIINSLYQSSYWLTHTNTRSLPTKQINYILHMLNVSYIFLVNIGNELMFFLDFKTSSSLLLKSLILRIWEYSCCCCARRKFFQGTMLLVIRHCCGLVYMSPSLHLFQWRGVLYFYDYEGSYRGRDGNWCGSLCEATQVYRQPLKLQ